jgi:hypothetical protein
MTLEEFNLARAFERWLHCSEKCICISGGYVRKASKYIS